VHFSTSKRIELFFSVNFVIQELVSEMEPDLSDVSQKFLSMKWMVRDFQIYASHSFKLTIDWERVLVYLFVRRARIELWDIVYQMSSVICKFSTFSFEYISLKKSVIFIVFCIG
jgi:hypothetical protein